MKKTFTSVPTKFSKTERHELYEEALENMIKFENEWDECGATYICWELQRAIQEKCGWYVMTSFIPDLFPEFLSFKPKKITSAHDPWWPEGLRYRKIVLKRCIELSKRKNAKQ